MFAFCTSLGKPENNGKGWIRKIKHVYEVSFTRKPNISNISLGEASEESSKPQSSEKKSTPQSSEKPSSSAGGLQTKINVTRSTRPPKTVILKPNEDVSNEMRQGTLDLVPTHNRLNSIIILPGTRNVDESQLLDVLEKDISQVDLSNHFEDVTPQDLNDVTLQEVPNKMYSLRQQRFVAQREKAKQAYEESKKTPIVSKKTNIAASASAGPVGSNSEIRNARKKDHINRFKELDRIKRDQRNKRVKRRNRTSNSDSSSSDDNSSKDELIISKKNKQLASSSDSSSHNSEESYSGSNWEHSGDSDSESIFVYEKEEEEESVSESDLITSEKKQSVKKSQKSDLKITKKRKLQESSESSTTRKSSTTSVPSTPKKHMKKNRKPPTPTQIQRERDIAVFNTKSQHWIAEQTKKLDDILKLIDLLNHEHNYIPPRMMWSNVIPVEKGSDMYPYYMLVMLTTTPATNDKSVITTFEMLFKKTGDDLTPQGMLDFDKKHLLRYLSPMGRQNINMEMLIEQAQQLMEQHDGKVPITYDALIKLPGVGPKIANILLYDAFDMVHVSIL